MDSHTRSAFERLEIVETGRRRRWSAAEKRRIILESLAGPRRVSSTASAVTEAGGASEVAAAILGLPKAEAVQAAQEALQGKGWLPPALRIQTATVAATSEAASEEVASDGDGMGDGAEIGNADPAQAPDDGGGQSGSTKALIAAE